MAVVSGPNQSKPRTTGISTTALATLAPSILFLPVNSLLYPGR
jgi:hypothetical protein